MSDIERRLKALTPTGVDRDAVLFEAGRRSAGPPVFWPLATLASSACAIALGLCLALRTEPPAPPPAAEPPAPKYPSPPAARRWEERILDLGLDGLGPPPPPLAPGPAFFKGDV